MSPYLADPMQQEKLLRRSTNGVAGTWGQQPSVEPVAQQRERDNVSPGMQEDWAQIRSQAPQMPMSPMTSATSGMRDPAAAANANAFNAQQQSPMLSRSSDQFLAPADAAQLHQQLASTQGRIAQDRTAQPAAAPIQDRSMDSSGGGRQGPAWGMSQAPAPTVQPKQQQDLQQPRQQQPQQSWAGGVGSMQRRQTPAWGAPQTPGPVSSPIPRSVDQQQGGQYGQMQQRQRKYYGE